MDTQTPTPSVLPRCRMCGVEDYFLANHLAEAHNLTLDDYLTAFPGSPTIAEETLQADTNKQPKNLRRTGPPASLTTQILDFTFPVNMDVDESACLPLPPHYRFPTHGDLSLDIKEALISISRGRHVYIHGLPGSGKDALISAWSNLTRKPCLLRQIQPGTDVESWLFTRDFDANGTRWTEEELLIGIRDGFLTNTGRRIPYTIVITDFDRATKNQAEYLRLILDSIHGRVPGPAGKVYSVMPGTQILVTANTAGGGDPRGRAISANVIDSSILDRFERKYQFHWMSWEDEGPICEAKFPMLAHQAPELFKQVGEATNALRNAVYNNTLYAEFSHRALCSWLGHAEDIVAVTGQVPKDLARRSARAFLDGLPDEESRLAADRLIEPHIKAGLPTKNQKNKDEPALFGDFNP